MMVAKRKPVRQAVADNAPWKPAPYGLEQAGAIQALARGDAAPHQQQLALKWIVETVCGYYDISFRPGGLEGERESNFAEGKRHVGAQVVKMTRLNLSRLKKEERNG